MCLFNIGIIARELNKRSVLTLDRYQCIKHWKNPSKFGVVNSG